jgi:hypothetical protein
MARKIILKLIFLQYALQSSWAQAQEPEETQSLLSPSAISGQTVIVTESEGATYSQIFLPTSLSGYASITAPTTITSTNAAGAILLIEIVAGGLGWWWLSPPPGQPPIDPPKEPPQTEPPQQSTPPQTSIQTTAMSTSLSSSTSTPPETYTQNPGIRRPNKFDWKAALNQFPAQLPQIEKTCGGFANDDPATVPHVDQRKNIKDFCKEHSGNKIIIGWTEEKIYPNSAGTRLNITVAQNPTCSGDLEQKLDENDCKYFLGYIDGTCDMNQGDTFGGILRDGCFIYMLHPQDEDGDLFCNDKGDGTGLNTDEALESIRDFCERNHGHIVKPNEPHPPNEYYQTLGDSSGVFTVEWYDDCQKEGEEIYTIDQRACQRFLERTVKECNKNPVDKYGKYGGIVTDTLNCGTYKFQPKVVEDIHCLPESENPYDPKHAIDWEHHAAGAIETYCNTDMTLDPEFVPDGKFHTEPQLGQSNYNYYKDSKSGADIGYVIYSMNQFLDNVECIVSKIKHKTGGPECKRKLYSMFDKCESRMRAQ